MFTKKQNILIYSWLQVVFEQIQYNLYLYGVCVWSFQVVEVFWNVEGFIQSIIIQVELSLGPWFDSEHII